MLLQNDLCPGITEEDLRKWRYEKIYPESSEFRGWLVTKEVPGTDATVNPYYFRWLAATREMDLRDRAERHWLGRAFYHLAQRRGYKSNRISGDEKDEKDGKVTKSIEALDAAMGDRTLGQYYYEDCLGEERIRGEVHYTSRKHYEDEFNRICVMQNLAPALRKALDAAIFFQRPLKSQKGSVGGCLLEPGKPRAAISHPLYERFRALQTLNNIRLHAPGEAASRPLSTEERASALQWLLKQGKPIKFEKLAKKIVPRRAKVAHVAAPESHENTDAYRFNYRMDTTIAACPTISRLAGIFGEQWEAVLPERYRKAGSKTNAQVVNDIWHAMFSFDSPECLKRFAVEQLGLDEGEASSFAAPLPQGYAGLSLKAIRKILPFLEKGLIYSHAVFMANMPTITAAAGRDWQSECIRVEKAFSGILDRQQLDSCCERVVNAHLKRIYESGVDTEIEWAIPENVGKLETAVEADLAKVARRERWTALPEDERKACVRRVALRIRTQAGTGSSLHAYVPVLTIEQRIAAFLIESYGLTKADLKPLYHPSAIEIYPAAAPGADGALRLGSPRIDSIKNPVFMRAMHRLRTLVNALLDEGLIDSDTRIRLEMARDLNTANERAALDQWHRARENDRQDHAARITEAGFTATDETILKYQLWVEQEKRCLYTNNSIGLAEFLGDNPVYDVEHTIPRSLRLDNSQSNLTLCDRRFNREVKRNRIPQQLDDAEAILERASAMWGPTIERLEVAAEKARAAGRAAGDMAAKNKARTRYLLLRMELRYWKQKLAGFAVEDPPDGFTNSQLVDTRIICKYAMLYLKTLFQKVYSVKANALADIKTVWGLDTKSRDTHLHHAIDAIVVASLTPRFVEQLGAYFHAYERYEKSHAPKPNSPQPWPGFDKELNDGVGRDILVVHHHVPKLLKQTFKRVRRRGKVQTTADGKAKISRGDSIRGQLHEETNYGKIRLPPHADTPDREICVVRKKLEEIKNIDDIVDPVVREIVRINQDKIGKEPIWFNREKKIPIRTARIRKAETVIALSEHRDVSKHAHKRHRYVASGNNYITALYRSEPDPSGKRKGSWKLVSNYDAVQAHKNDSWGDILPPVCEKGYKLAHILKSGTQVLFYRESPDELLEADSAALGRRLYRVTVMEGRLIKFNHHLTARKAKELGHGDSRVDWEAPVPNECLRLSVNGINILVEGADFRLTPIGGIEWLESARA